MDENFMARKEKLEYTTCVMKKLIVFGFIAFLITHQVYACPFHKEGSESQSENSQVTDSKTSSEVPVVKE